MKNVSKSERAGLNFPVAKIQARAKRRFPGVRITSDVGVSTAAILEYLSAEILELSGNNAKLYRKSRISPLSIILTIKEDEELLGMLKYSYRDLKELFPPPPRRLSMKNKKDMVNKDYNEYVNFRSPYEVEEMTGETLENNLKKYEENQKNQKSDDSPIEDDDEDPGMENEEYADDYVIAKSEYEFTSDEDEESEE